MRMLHKRRADRAKDTHVEMENNITELLQKESNTESKERIVWCEQKAINTWKAVDVEEKCGKCFFFFRAPAGLLKDQKVASGPLPSPN